MTNTDEVTTRSTNEHSLAALAADLRRGSDLFWKCSTDPRDQGLRTLRNGATMIAEIPSAHGTVLSVFRTPSRAAGGAA
jgi:hypothetical protein